MLEFIFGVVFFLLAAMLWATVSLNTGWAKVLDEDDGTEIYFSTHKLSINNMGAINCFIKKHLAIPGASSVTNFYTVTLLPDICYITSAIADGIPGLTAIPKKISPAKVVSYNDSPTFNAIYREILKYTSIKGCTKSNF